MKNFWKTVNKGTWTAKVGIVILIIWVLVAALAPLLAPYGVNDIDIIHRLTPPCWQEGGSAVHILGTDQLGRDVLTRLIYGSQTSLIVGLVSVVVGMVIGVTLGLMAGYFGGWVDAVISRIIDIMLAFP